MRVATAAPRDCFSGPAAGREKVSAIGGFPHRRGYHTGRRAGRGAKVYVDTPQGRRCAGVILRDGEGRVVLRRLVREDRHLLRVPEEAWAFDEQVLQQAEVGGAELVEVIDERGRRWWTPLVFLVERGERFDRGHGRQVRLPLRLWSFMPARRGDGQLGLFGELGT